MKISYYLALFGESLAGTPLQILNGDETVERLLKDCTPVTNAVYKSIRESFIARILDNNGVNFSNHAIMSVYLGRLNI